MNRTQFFSSLRKRDSGVFGTSLSQRQVDGLEALLDAAVGLSVPEVANVLAQVYRETGGGMYPVKETVYPHSKDKNPTDAQVIARLDRAWRKGQLPWVSKPYWRTGMFGRGQLQITHELNYRKCSKYVGIDLVRNLNAVLDPEISAICAVEGMKDGIFTGRKLSQFSKAGGYDHNRARTIVNGDRNKPVEKGSSLTVGQQIEGWALSFERALKSAGWGSGQSPVANEPTIVLQAKEKPKTGWVAIIAALFGGKS